jgi:hypothetical protein
MQHRYPGALALSRRALGWLRVLNIAYGIGIGFMLVVSLVKPEFLFAALGVGATRGRTAPILAMRGIMVVGIAGAFIAHRILTALQRMVETVRDGDPFVLDNAARLQSIAWWLLVAELLHLLVGVLARFGSTPAQPLDIDWTFSFTPWIAVLLLFVLARVFEHGARMREDIAGTV